MGSPAVAPMKTRAVFRKSGSWLLVGALLDLITLQVRPVAAPARLLLRGGQAPAYHVRLPRGRQVRLPGDWSEGVWEADPAFRLYAVLHAEDVTSTCDRMIALAEQDKALLAEYGEAW